MKILNLRTSSSVDEPRKSALLVARLRVATFVALLLQFSWILAREVEALDFIASGSFDSSPLKGTWDGQFQSGGERVRGTVIFSSLLDRSPVKVVGILRPSGESGDALSGEMEIYSDEPGVRISVWASASYGAIDGRMNYNGDEARIRGTFQLAPGRVPARASLVEIAQEEPIGEPELRVDELPHRPCDILADTRMTSRLSGGALSALQRSCRPGNGSSSAPPGLLSRMAKLADWVISLAYGQPPTNYLANNPSLDTFPRITQNETAVAVSSTNSNVMMVGYNDTGEIVKNPTPTPSLNDGVGYSRSANGGASWTDLGNVESVPGHEAIADPTIASGRFGWFYFGAISHRRVQNTYYIQVGRSVDFGQTFDIIANASPLATVGVQDKPDIAVDLFSGSPYYGRIYVCWWDFGLGGIRFSYSTNDGGSYTQLTNPISQTVPTNVNGCSIAVGPNGRVWVAWWDKFSSTKKIIVVRSTNGGVSFSSEVVITQGFTLPGVGQDTCLGAPFVNGPIAVKFWGNIAADPLFVDNVYAVWQASGASTTEIYFSRGNYTGPTPSWSSPVIINDVTTGDQFFPRIATNIFQQSPPQSRLEIIWYDRRLDPANLALHVFGATSFNQGTTWSSDSQVTTASSPVPQTQPNFDCSFSNPCYMGDYIGLTAKGGNFLMAWGDNRTNATGLNCSNEMMTQPDPNVMTAVGC